MKTDFIEKIIENYLTINEIPHAILLEGGWGIGKTYYWKNILENKIKLTEIPENRLKNIKDLKNYLPTTTTEKLKYEPVYISLFGVSTIDEIRLQLLFNLVLGDLDNHNSRAIFLLFRNSLNFFIKANTKVDISDAVKDLKVEHIFQDILPKIVLCIDDLERTSDKLSLIEVLGFINLLVEHYNVKVIIIANETKITETFTKDDYKKITEKLIGRSIKFSQDKYELLENISCNFETQGFKELIVKNKDLIVNLLENFGDNNIRSLIFSLNNLQVIFNSLETSDSSNEVIIKQILIFTLISSFEYKKKVFIKTDELKNYLSKTRLAAMFDNMYEKPKDLTPEEELDNNFKDKVKRVYKSQNLEYFFFDSLSDFIISCNFDIDKLNIELNDFRDREIDILTKISNNYKELSDDELILYTETLIKNIEECEFENPNKYIKSLYYLFLFLEKAYLKDNVKERLIKFPNSLPQKLRDSLNTGKLKKFPISLKDRKIFKPFASASYDSYSPEKWKELKNKNDLDMIYYFIKKEIEPKLYLDEENKLKKILFEDINQFFNELLFNYERYRFKDFLEDISPKTFYDKIIHSENKFIDNLNRFLEFRYFEDNNTFIIKSEINSLIIIKDKINDYIRDEGKNIPPLKLSNLNELIEIIIKIKLKNETAPNIS